jgi:hypothetical protein
MFADARVQERARRSELRAVVHAQHREKIVGENADDAIASGKPGDRVGQIVFALRVVVAQLRDRAPQLGFVERVKPRIHFVEVELARCRVARFDDPRDAIAVAYDAPERRRERHARGHERERRVARRVDRAFDQLGFDERQIAVEHQDRPVARRQFSECGLHSVPRSELRLL